MKDIGLLIRQRKEFYLTVLVLTLFLTIIGAVYNMNIVTKAFDLELNADTATVEQVEKALAERADVFRNGLSSEGLMRGFFKNYTYMGYAGLNPVIVAVMLLSYSDRSGKGVKEFLETLPVKRVALELYNYVAIAGILLIDIIVSVLIHLMFFNQYNQKIVMLAERFPELLGAVVPDKLLMINNMSLLYQFGMMTLFLLVMITFLFVFTTIFKKSAIGLSVGFLLWHSMSEFMYDIRFLYRGTSIGEIPVSFRMKTAVFEPAKYFERFEWTDGICTNDFTAYVVTVLSVMLVVMISILIAHAYFRELSKGKVFYMNALNIVLLVFGGLRFFVWVEVWVGLVEAVIFTLIAEAVAVYLLYHRKDKFSKLAVKEVKKVHNPILAQGLKSYLIAASVITLIVQYIDVTWCLEPLRQDFGETNHIWNNIWNDSQLWYIGNFELPLRIQYAMIIVLGYIVFKCILFSMERTGTAREFYETLPISRIQTYCTKILMDLVLVIIPLMVFTLTSVGYIIYYNWVTEYRVLDDMMLMFIGEQFLVAGIILCIVICCMGVMYLIDAVTVNGGMKNIYCGVAAVFGFVVSVLILEEGINTVFYDMIILIWEYTPTPLAIVYLIIGIVLLIIAGYLYLRRDKAKEIFYYKSAKYIFAMLLSLSYLFFALAGVNMTQMILQCFLAVIGTVLFFWMTILYCTPEYMVKLQKRFSKKSQKK